MANLTSIVPKKIFTVASYQKQLLQLLPKGAIWKNLSATTKLLFEALAVEFNRVDQRIVDLRREAVPGLSTASELLADWESEAGITPATSDSESFRQNRVHTRLNTNFGNPTDAFFIQYALDAFGMVITISHTTDPFRCGEDRIGDDLNGTGGFFVFKINVVSDPNSKLNELKDFIEQMKPAHTLAIY